MKLTIHYANQNWQFDFISVGGKQTATETRGDDFFASNLVVALHNPIADMNDLYILLAALTHNAWHGFIPINQDYLQGGYHPTLVGWQVRKTIEGESGEYICQIDYKIFMPNKIVSYEIG